MYVAVRVITGLALNNAGTLSKIGYGPLASMLPGVSTMLWYVLRNGPCSVSSTFASWKHKNF